MVAYNTVDEFRDSLYSFQKSRVILTGYELGIFTAIGKEKKSSSDVARIINTEPRATDRLMNALVVCGLLIKQNNIFRNTDFAIKHLVEGEPEFIAGLGHTINMWDTWSKLTKAVKTGKTVRKVNERNEKFNTSFIAAMHDRASRQAAKVISKLRLDSVEKILDVGGGSGAYSIAFAQAKQSISCVVFDLPDILPITQKYIDSAHLRTRISTLAGDYHFDDFGGKYDMVFLSAIIHINDHKANYKLIKKCANALNPGGYVVIQDHVLNEDRISPPNGVLFALNMLVATKDGDTYTEKEIYDYLNNAGLSEFQRIETFKNSMIIGRKSIEL